MGAYESFSKIKKVHNEMGIVWDRTKALWRDEKAEQFEAEFIERLAIEVDRSKTALENISITLNQLRSELKVRD